jgi:hypothetical protein
MAETIKLFGKPMNKNIVLFGGAAAVGLVGYAWFKSGQEPEGLPPGSLPDPVPVPTDTPGFEVLGTVAPPGTNADWSQLAIERLANIGIDAPTLSAAIGKFLAKKPLNKTEADLVRQAMAVAGIPPENGPWSIIEETTGGTPPPAPTAPGAVTGFRYVGPTDPTHHQLAWDAVPGATQYIIQYAGPGGSGPEWPETGTSHVAYLAAGPTYTYTVQAVNNVGRGPKAVLSWHAR